jgi:hypothetical protein
MENANKNLRLESFIYVIGALFILLSLVLPLQKGTTDSGPNTDLWLAYSILAADHSLNGFLNNMILLSPYAFCGLLLFSIFLGVFPKLQGWRARTNLIGFVILFIQGWIVSVVLLSNTHPEHNATLNMLAILWILLLMGGGGFITLRIRKVGWEDDLIRVGLRFLCGLACLLWFWSFGMIGVEIQRGILIARVGSGIVLIGAIVEYVFRIRKKKSDSANQIR